jgi:hypothetical protein
MDFHETWHGQYDTGGHSTVDCLISVRSRCWIADDGIKNCVIYKYCNMKIHQKKDLQMWHGSGQSSEVSFFDDSDGHWCSLTLDTERWRQLGNTPALYLGGPRFDSQPSPD